MKNCEISIACRKRLARFLDLVCFSYNKCFWGLDGGARVSHSTKLPERVLILIEIFLNITPKLKPEEQQSALRNQQKQILCYMNIGFSSYYHKKRNATKLFY